MPSNILFVENLTKSFGNNIVFQNVSARYESGKIYGIIGRNGCGKSVYFKVLCGLLSPSNGTIRYNNLTLGKNIDYLNCAGILIETPNFYDDYTGYQNLEYLLSINKKYKMDNALKYVELLNMKENMKKKVKSYSLGMKQKLGIIQAVMEEQEVLILDEPFNSLDSESVESVRKLLLDLKEQGRIILLCSHIKEDIDQLTDVKYKFENGKLLLTTDLAQAE